MVDKLGQVYFLSGMYYLDNIPLRLLKVKNIKDLKSLIKLRYYNYKPEKINYSESDSAKNTFQFSFESGLAYGKEFEGTMSIVDGSWVFNFNGKMGLE